MIVPLPWERLLWRGRPWWPRGEEYALTDFRLIRTAKGLFDEIAVGDIVDVHRMQSPMDRLAGTSILIVSSRHSHREPVVLRRLRRGPQLAALLELLAGDPQPRLDPAAVEAALSWEPRMSRRGYAETVSALVLVVVAAGTIAIVASLHGKAAAIVYAADDAIYPGGEKKDRAAIMKFMEQAVMPWARETLGPLKGGPERITCETCHGTRPSDRDWRMPAVAALPTPEVAGRGWEIYSVRMDTQMRNAIYGYVADSDKQARATYMREVVMPGMARLLHRPQYDFTRAYGYNRTRNAFGCYHCHRVK